MDEASLANCYRAADVSVVPTIELEGFGLAVIESLACGTPVITTDVGGLPEATSGLAGRLTVPAGSPEALAGALTKALGADGSLPSRDECRVYAERFGPSALVERHRAVYRRAGSAASPRRPRVVYLDHCARLSGAEICLLRILGATSASDAHVILGEEGPLELRLREAGVSTEVLPLGDAAMSAKRDLARRGPNVLSGGASAAAYAARLSRRLRKLDPDLIHTNSLKSGVYGAAAARIARLPLVWHLHDRLATDYMSGDAARLTRIAIGKGADAVIANSETTLMTLDEVARDKATVISPPVDLPPNPVEIRETVRRVGIVGRLAPWKGQHVFLSAMERAFNSSGAEAVLIGSPLFGEEAYADGLRHSASQLGDLEVSFRGFVDDVPAELGQLDVLVHASTSAEPFGQVVLEGMAAGLPVVAAGAGGPAEIISDGRDGLLYTPGDVEALADRLRLLAGDRRLRSRLGEAGRRKASEFAPSRIAEKVAETHRAVLERNRR